MNEKPGGNWIEWINFTISVTVTGSKHQSISACRGVISGGVVDAEQPIPPPHPLPKLHFVPVYHPNLCLPTPTPIPTPQIVNLKFAYIIILKHLLNNMVH